MSEVETGIKVLCKAAEYRKRSGEVLTLPYVSDNHIGFLRTVLWASNYRGSSWASAMSTKGFIVSGEAWTSTFEEAARETFKERADLMQKKRLIQFMSVEEYSKKTGQCADLHVTPGARFSKEEFERREKEALWFKVWNEVIDGAERVLVSASRYALGGKELIVTSARHWDTMVHRIVTEGLFDGREHRPFRNTEVQGFVTSKGRFVDRNEAFDIAEAQGQIIHLCGSEHNGRLYSENLYTGKVVLSE